MSGLTIPDRRDRVLVAAADLLLRPAALARLGRTRPSRPTRVVCFRLERIGDLLMAAPAIVDLKIAFPESSIDLVVGSWNREIAAAIPSVDRVETLNAAWLSRPSALSREGGQGVSGLVRQAARWRSRRYELAINFEPDIRSNLVMACVGAGWTAGFLSGGGGAVLDTALEYDTTIHTTDNARALVRAIASGGAGSKDPGFITRDPASTDHGPTGADAGRVFRPGTAPTLTIPQASRDEAARLLARFNGSPRIGLHVSGGRPIKQWPEGRFRDVAERLVRDRSAAIVLTGTPADRPQVEAIRAALPGDKVLDLSTDLNLLTVAAVLEQLDLFVTGDTGPMHLAYAVGTPVVAIFGPSQPWRYGPRGLYDRVVRVDLPCSPCNRIRVPPARCTGHTPDCLERISTTSVLAAIDELLGEVKR